MNIIKKFKKRKILALNNTEREREREMDVEKKLSGIRHPINLLLANRLANCERMLALESK